jgi:hypothetical protein
MKFNHKSLGGFDVHTIEYVGKPGTNRLLMRKMNRVMVTIDAAALAEMLGPKAVTNKKGRTRLCGGAIELVNLGSVVK